MPDDSRAQAVAAERLLEREAQARVAAGQQERRTVERTGEAALERRGLPLGGEDRHPAFPRRRLYARVLTAGGAGVSASTRSSE